MPRYTSNQKEIKKIKQWHEHSDFGVIKVILKDDTAYTGLIISERAGSNATEALLTGDWKFYGAITLMTLDKKEVDIDLLDIKYTQKASEKDKEQMIKVIKEMEL